LGARSEIEQPPLLESLELLLAPALELPLPAVELEAPADELPADEVPADELPALPLAPALPVAPPPALASTVFVHCRFELHVAPSAAHLQFADVVHQPSVPEPVAVAARHF